MGAAALPLGKKHKVRKVLVGTAVVGPAEGSDYEKQSNGMKRIGNLYQEVISLENLYLADEKARKGKKKSYGVRVHDRNREANLLALHEALLTKTFRTSPYEVFTIHEPKERQIYRLPYYPDRIVHHAIMNILEPIWVKTFTHNTYSCIKGRGIEGCARQVEKNIRSFKGKPLYCLKIDIKKFYPSVNHHVLKGQLRRKLKDKDLLWLLDLIIDSTAGLPIGNFTSQFLANLNLCYFMHWVNEKLSMLVMKALGLSEKPRILCTEYADDIVFMSESKAVLHKVFELVKAYMENVLDLAIKGNYQLFPIAKNRHDKSGRALDYVGYKFFREQKLIRKSIKQNFCRMTARLNKGRFIHEIEYKQAIAPWLGWAKHSNSRHLLRTIIRKDYYESIL